MSAPVHPPLPLDRALAVVRSMASSEGPDGEPWRALLEHIAELEAKVKTLDLTVLAALSALGHLDQATKDRLGDRMRALVGGYGDE